MSQGDTSCWHASYDLAYASEQNQANCDVSIEVASALGNHRSRFREANGLASWDARDGSKGYTEAIRSRLSQEQRDNNTTEVSSTPTDLDELSLIIVAHRVSIA